MDLIKPPFESIADITSENFEQKALDLFRFQSKNCAVYKEFLSHFNFEIDRVLSLNDIPFLPIQFFKSRVVITDDREAEIAFKSSGTSGMNRSQHLVHQASIYEESFNLGFEKFYGDPNEYCILGLLPSYLEQGESSLVYMVDHLIKKSEHPLSGFYLHNQQELYDTLTQLRDEKKPVILFGVTYALVDFAEQSPIDFPGLVVMETGGMKGRKKEMIREELHAILKKGFGTTHIHSEYGMTELLSQGYMQDGVTFSSPDWMRIQITDLYDQSTKVRVGKTGRICVMDLANIYSCAFIATDDLGQLDPRGQFKVLGRIDHSDIRGCSLLI